MKTLFISVLAMAALSLAASAQTPAIISEMSLTYDSGMMTVDIYAYTEADDADLFDYYEVVAIANVYLNVYDANGNLMSTTLQYSASAVDQTGVGEASVEGTIVALPSGVPGLPSSFQVTYSGLGIHSFNYMVSDPAYQDGSEFDDPYGFSLMSTIDNGSGQVTATPPYLIAVIPPFLSQVRGHTVAKTHPTPAAPPPAGFSVTSNGSPLSTNCPSVNLANFSPLASGTQIPCTFIGFQPGDQSQTPVAPGLQASLTGVNAGLDVYWNATRNFSKAESTGCPGSWSETGPTGTGSTSGSGAFNVSQALSSGNLGGTITVSWQVGSSPTQSYQFGLWGTNPSPSVVQAALANTPGAPWYAEFIVKEESLENYLQFNPASATGIFNTPDWGRPCGFGVGQIEATSATKNFSSDIWNWQTNIADAVAIMLSKQARGYTEWNTAFNAYKAYFIGNFDLPGFVQPPCEMVNNVTFNYFNDLASVGVILDNRPINASYEDANNIKHYNGDIDTPYMDWNVKNTLWVASRWNSSNVCYVNKVLSESLPQ